MSSETSSELVKIDELVKEPYVNVLCYPKPDFEIAIKRIDELKLLKVKGIFFEGKIKIGKLGVVGKGCVSIVVKALTDFGIFALKIRRMDANRISMERESEMHSMANSVNVGPRLFEATENFLLMEFIEGYSILEWLKRIEEQSIERVRKVLKELLDQCYALDKSGLDHGELSDPKKHVIISKMPVIIDFESASISRRVANLTKVVQYLFIGGPMAKRLRKILGIEDERIIIDSVKNYKVEKDQENYLKLLSGLNLV
ncbi:MAG: serine/threonine protein kinase [archaeon]|nr:serine/threonine protein kinase [archaeon]MCP8322309.1 serine/threonine protein kinase [archaeon]